MMRKMVLAIMFGVSVSVCAGDEVYSLSPSFYDMSIVGFTSVDSGRGRTIKGYLESGRGMRYNIPDACEPEGGDAELIDAFTVIGKKNYFLFRCAWSVQHAGLGLKGVQYEAFIYSRNRLGVVIKEKEISRILSGYEGALESGEKSYAWYYTRKIATEKLLDFDSGEAADSLSLAHDVVLSRLSQGDLEAIKAYLSSERVKKLAQYFPISKSTVVAYNDFGYALAKAGDDVMAYELLRTVERAFPDRVVLKLNIADVLWGADKSKAKAYYKEYIDLMKKSGKETSIPLIVLERADYK